MAEADALLHRDAIDTRIIGYLKLLDKEGKIFKTEAEASGQGKVQGGTPLTDTDAWEKSNGLDPKMRRIGNATSAQAGYTNLEKYLNELVVKH